MTIKSLSTITICLFFVAACGGGGGSSPAPSNLAPTTPPPPPPQSIKIVDGQKRTAIAGDMIILDATITADSYLGSARISSSTEDTTMDIEVFNVDKTSIVPNNPDIFGDLTPLLFRRTFGDGTTSDVIQVSIDPRGIVRAKDSRGFFVDVTDTENPLNGLAVIPGDYELNSSYTRRFVIVGDDLVTPRYTGEVTTAIGSKETIQTENFGRVEVIKYSIELTTTATDDYWINNNLDIYKTETEQIVWSHPEIGSLRSEEKTSIYEYRSSSSPDVIAYLDLELRSVNYSIPEATDD